MQQLPKLKCRWCLMLPRLWWAENHVSLHNVFMCFLAGFLPKVTGSTYNPQLLTSWAAGDLAWSDKTDTFTDFGDLTQDRFQYKVRLHVWYVLTCCFMMVQVKTKVAAATSSYTIIPQTRSKIVVISSGSNPPQLSASVWDTKCSGISQVHFPGE